MKKLFLLLFLAFTAVIAVNAVNYPIQVMGIQVTDANKNNVLGDGKFVYEPDKNILTVFGGTYTRSSKSIVEVTSEMTEDFEMRIMGDVTMKTSDGHPIAYSGQGDFIIWGRIVNIGKLTLDAAYGGKVGIDILSNANLKIKGLDVTINSTGIAIGTHLKPHNQVLTLEKCDLHLTGGTAALRFKDVVLDGCVYQTGYAINGFDANGNGTYNGTVMKDVRIDAEDYKISVAGIAVNARNAERIMTGVSYDVDNNELELNNANITTTANSAIFANQTMQTLSKQKTFKVRLKGANKITHTGRSAALYFAPIHVDSTLIYSTNGGSLDVNSSSIGGVLFATIQPKVTIKDCTVNLKTSNSSVSAIKGDASKRMNLTFVNATVTAETSGSTVLTDVDDLRFFGCFMKTPTEAFLNSQFRLITMTGTTPTKLEVVPGKDNVKPFLFYGDAVELVEATATTAKIKFNRAMDNLTDSQDILYHLYVAKDKITGSWVQDRDLDIRATSSLLNYEVKNLKPETTYFIRLKAIDKAGNYVFYKDLELKTDRDKSPVVPGGDCVYVTSEETTMYVTWDPATDDLTPADKLKYYLSYWEADQGESKNKWAVNVNGTSAHITDLKPNTSYYVRPMVQDESGHFAQYPATLAKTKPVNYGIIIRGEQLAEHNIANYASSGITFDPETQTLTFDNVYLRKSTKTEATVVFIKGGITLNLKGKNTVEGNSSAFFILEGGTITSSDGTGKLICSASDEYSSGITTDGALVIKACTVEVTCPNGFGIFGSYATSYFEGSTLLVDNANVKTKGSLCYIGGFGGLALTNCYIASPVGAKVGGVKRDSQMGIYYADDSGYAGNVEIVAGKAPSAIEAIEEYGSDVKRFNVVGMPVDKSYRGIVIINGKKYSNK